MSIVVVRPATAVATPSARKVLDVVHPGRPSLTHAEAIGDVTAAHALAELLKRTVDRHITSDGRVDWIDIASDLVAWMKDHQK